MKNLLRKIIPSPLIKLAKSTLGSIGKSFEKIPDNGQVFNDSNRQVFFGYYDITPFSNNGNFLLAQQAPPENTSPHGTHPDLALGYYDLWQADPVFKSFAKTSTWNWQQGCRLQWYPQDNDKTTQVIFNSKDEDNYISVIQDIASGEIIQTLPMPIYSVSPDGSFALSLDFDRLHKCRPGYGYSHFPDRPCKDAIWRIEIPSGQVKEVMTMEQVRQFNPLPSMEKADHYFNHLSISPSGLRFMVTHLWVTPSGKRHTRIIVANTGDYSDYICPNNSGHTSHYCWLNDDRVIIFGIHENQKPQYHLYDLTNNTSEVIGENTLRQDGHPTWASANHLLTDTYPDYLRLQHLLYYDTNTKNCRELGAFYSPSDFVGEVRCDLHPRLNHKKDRACIDIVRDGRRAMCIVDIPER